MKIYGRGWSGGSTNGIIHGMFQSPSCSLFGLIDSFIRAALNDVTEINSSKSKSPNSNPEWKGSVINLSFKYQGDTLLMHDALTKVYKAGIPMAASAGNALPEEILPLANHLPCM